MTEYRVAVTAGHYGTFARGNYGINRDSAHPDTAGVNDDCPDLGAEKFSTHVEAITAACRNQCNIQQRQNMHMAPCDFHFNNKSPMILRKENREETMNKKYSTKSSAEPVKTSFAQVNQFSVCFYYSPSKMPISPSAVCIS